MKVKEACSLEEKLWQPRQHIKKQRCYFETLFCHKGPSNQSYGSFSSHVWMWELDHKESWVPKNWCFQTVVLEKTLESPLNSKIKTVNPKGNPPGIFIGRTDAAVEALIIWPPDVKSQLIGKDPDAEKGWEQENRVAEDEIVGWHHRMDMSSSKLQEIVKDRKAWRAWGCKESDTTWQPINN